jgi:inosose dehydratase
MAENQSLTVAHPQGALMYIHQTRRNFVVTLAAAAAASALPSFAAPITSGIHFGYTAMTWGDNERQAIDDISSLGFPGIQFRNNAVTDFKPAELKDLLTQFKLTFVALSSGEVLLDAPEAGEIAKHVRNAQFLKDSGGLYLQVFDQLKPYPRTVTPEECKRLGKLLTEIGKRTVTLASRLVITTT